MLEVTGYIMHEPEGSALHNLEGIIASSECTTLKHPKPAKCVYFWSLDLFQIIPSQPLTGEFTFGMNGLPAEKQRSLVLRVLFL